ncbi:cysteine synthase family protein [Aggregatilineales bacterium SYSU G02658]
MSAIRQLDYTLGIHSQSLESQIGNTPLLSFQRITADLPPYVRVYAKAEWMNPGGSVKDRAAYSIITTAERDGHLRAGKILTDATSGNTGIAYAMIGAARGHRVRLFLPENASPERIAILRAYGAELILTPAEDGTDGAIYAVRDEVAAHPERYFYADQYSNPANWQAHYKTTGVEIWHQTHGQVTHFVAGLGTSGTFMGTGRRLRDYHPRVHLISSQPDAAIHRIEGWKHMESALNPAIYDPHFAERNVPVSTEAAYAMAKRLAREEGYLVGVSAAAAMVAAMTVAEEAAARHEHAVIVTLFPDSAYKYLSERFWTED